MSFRVALPAWALAGSLLGAPCAVGAQSTTQADSGYAATLIALKDSVSGVRLDLIAFQRDLPLAGPETVVRRATVLNRRCEGLIAAVRAFGPVVRSAGGSAREAADEFGETLERIRRGLGEECVRGLAPDGAGSRADTLRAWGPHRVAQIERLLAEYERNSRAFAHAVGVRLEPRSPRRERG